jgi:hypothetical protein
MCRDGEIVEPERLLAFVNRIGARVLLLASLVWIPSADAAYRIRVTRITSVLSPEISVNSEADRLILEILPIPGIEHEFEGIELAPELLSGVQAFYLRDKLAKMWVDVWLSANEQVAEAKGFYVLGDPFHKELIEAEHPGDGRSALFAIFEGDLNHALSTLRLAYTVPTSEGGILHVPMIQRLKRKRHLSPTTIAILENLSSKITPSNKVNFDWSNTSQTFLNHLLSLTEARVGHPIPVGGAFPAELKGIAHRVSASGADSLWYLLQVVLRSRALDEIPYDLTGHIPWEIFAETTTSHLEGPYKNWPLTRLPPEMSYFDKSVNKKVELVKWDRNQIADLFFKLSSRASSFKNYWLVNIPHSPPVMRRSWTWPETKNDPFVRSDFDKFRPVESWRSPPVPAEVLNSWKCRYGFGS